MTFDTKKLAYLSVFVVSLFFTVITLANSQSKIQIFNVAQNTFWFEQGNPNAPHQIYVVAEPNCSACHYFYNSVKPFVAQGQLKIRWIMVAFMKPSSLGKAAAILMSENPAAALEENESAFNNMMEIGGINAIPSIPSDIQGRLNANLNFMKTFGLHVTPIVLLKSTTGKIEIMRGALPQNLMYRFISTIGKY